MVKMNIFASALILLWMPCDYAIAKAPSAPSKPDQRILAAREVVKNNMKDPDSANFKNERASGENVCGEVNAKNSYGGYVGFKRYIVRDGAYYLDGDEWPLFDRWWGEACLE